MAEIRIDSWNSYQLSRLRDFFHNEAKEGDAVIFDKKLAERQASGGQTSKDWMTRMANLALEGLSVERMNEIGDTVSLTMTYLHSQYPEDAQHAAPPATQEPAASEWDDDGAEFDLEVLERTETKPKADVKADVKPDTATDAEAEAWAEIVAKHTTKPDRRRTPA